MKRCLQIIFYLTVCALANAQTGANITSWTVNKTGQKGQYYNSSYSVVSLTDSVDVQEVCYNTDAIYVRTNS